MQTALQYNRLAVLLHWAIALGVALQFSLGWWMTGLPDAGGVQARWFNLHKSIGLTIAALSIVRIAWRAAYPAPPLPASVPAWQRHTAHACHALLYFCLIALPLVGYLGSSFSGYPVRYFGYALPSWAWKWPAAKATLSSVHFGLTWLLAALVLLHVVGALLHVLQRDGLFHRMWPLWRNA